MAWKRLIAIVTVMTCVAMARTSSVFAYDVYNQGTISSTMVNYYNGILTQHMGESYIIWRNSQYEYCLALGEISKNNSIYRGDSIKVFTINTNVGYNETYRVNSSIVGSFSLANPNNYLIYTNIKGSDMPDLIERSDYIEITLLFTLCLFGIYKLVWDILKYGLR